MAEVAETMDPSFIPYRRAASHLQSKLKDAGINDVPTLAIICGSGLSGLSSALSEPTLTVPYGAIPGFPSHCTVPGHKGEIVFGYLHGILTACYRGRFHSYEGHDMTTVALPARVSRCLGVKILLVTNAAGGLNTTYHVGDIACISDHLSLASLAGKHPLVGPNDDELGPRFPPLSNAYDDGLQKTAFDAAKNLGFDSFFRNDATYCFASGPAYESMAEARLLRTQGGDAVGMSTIPEIIAAHHCGLKVLCLSLITNKVILKGEGEGVPAASHAEVLASVNNRSVQIQALVKEIVKLMSESGYITKLPELPAVSLVVPEEEEDSVESKGSFSFHSALLGVATFGIGVLVGSALLKRK